MELVGGDRASTAGLLAEHETVAPLSSGVTATSTTLVDTPSVMLLSWVRVGKETKVAALKKRALPADVVLVKFSLWI